MSFLKNPIIQKQQQPATKTQTQTTSIRVGFPFTVVCKYWQKIEDTTKRLEKLEYLSKLMIRMNVEFPEDIEPLLLLISNQIREPWLGQSVMNIGEQQVKKAIQNNFQVEPSRMKHDLQTTGDIGQLAQNYKSKQPKMFVQTKQLTVQYILQQFQAIADTQGQNSTQDKIDIMRRLMQDGSDLECRYLTRLLLGKNRLGFQRKTILFALSEYVCFLKMVASGKIEAFKAGDKIVDYVNAAWALISSQQVTNRIIDKMDADDEEDEEEAQEDEELEDDLPDDVPEQAQITDSESLENILSKINQKNAIDPKNCTNQRVISYIQVLKAFARTPSLTFIAKNAMRLAEVQVTPSIPILPMLAKPTSSYNEIFDKINGEKFACEYKYDGFRAQIHKFGNTFKIFSRSQEDMSQKFPDVLQSVKDACQSDFDFVIDGEIVPIDQNGEIAAFQMLSRRLKVYDESQNASKITMFVFDVMFCQKCLMDETFAVRRAILHKLLKQTDLVKYATSVNITDEDHLKTVLEEAVVHKTEGLIVKTLSSRYCPDRRSRHWLKLKKDYLEGIGDSLDLVPVAGWFGKGKRAGVIGAYLLCSLNKDVYESVTNIGTGFTDSFLEQMTNFFADKKLDSKPKNVKVTDQYLNANKPDFWFNPEESVVFEVKVANLSQSLMHTCYQIGDRGIAARLPRLIRMRDDKSVNDCSSSLFVYQRFKAQPDREDKEEDGNDEVGDDGDDE
ncbi:DNA_ligase [Hexamita inflata]|uniref:DNA ligase n=1 Tax=Hexamita inflata TaxID=28002 RepID=A0AA86P726_9EUKA|nr:DNA ligase [Hexamita inflata]